MLIVTSAKTPDKAYDGYYSPARVMKLYYKDEHTSCVNYLPNTNKEGFRYYKLKKGETCVLSRSVPVLVLAVKGSAAISEGLYKGRVLENGDIVLATPEMQVHVLSDAHSEFITCDVNTHTPLCHRFTTDLLVRHMSDAGYDFDKLKMNDRIAQFADLLKKCLSDGLNCYHFNTWKKEELMLFLRAYYSKEQLAALFYPILSKNTDFREFVLKNYKSVGSASEFARKANCSISTFNRRFKAFFNENAYVWLNCRRRENIENDLHNTDIPFSELTRIYGFSSQAYFSAFCKKHFGLTPKQIRKGR